MSDTQQIFTKCCKPLGRGNCSKSLRNILPWMLKKKSSLNLKQKICDSCRTKLSALNDEAELSVVPDSTIETERCDYESDQPYDSDRTYEFECENDFNNSKRAKLDLPYISKEIALNSLNKLLAELGEPPVDLKRLTQTIYCRDKVASIANILKSTIFTGHPPDLETSDNSGKVMLDQLKEKFRSSSKRSEKTCILTLLPRNWSIMKILTEFEGITKSVFCLPTCDVQLCFVDRVVLHLCVYVTCQVYLFK